MQQTAAEPTLSNAALRYASIGIPVFPCHPGAKQPLTSNGFHDATTLIKTVQSWWQRTPEANIGLPTGAATGVLVVDIDVHPSGNGFAAFERARSAGLADSWAWLVRTPSGGLHAYYPASDPEQRSWQIPSAHIDFRGDGGYVIAPPSRIVVDGVSKPYEVIAVTTGEAKAVDALALRRFLEPPRPIPVPPTWAAAHAKDCHPEALARTVALTTEGGRNRALFWASCRMAENGQSHAVAVNYLLPAAQHAGLPDREIESTINSAFRITSRHSPGSGPGPTQRSEAIQL